MIPIFKKFQAIFHTSQVGCHVGVCTFILTEHSGVLENDETTHQSQL